MESDSIYKEESERSVEIGLSEQLQRDIVNNNKPVIVGIELNLFIRVFYTMNQSESFFNTWSISSAIAK